MHRRAFLLSTAAALVVPPLRLGTGSAPAGVTVLEITGANSATHMPHGEGRLHWALATVEGKIVEQGVQEFDAETTHISVGDLDPQQEYRMLFSERGIGAGYLG